jgi:hypothetical protein
MLKKFLILTFAIFTLFFSFSALAQMSNDDIFIEANPKNPRTNQEVKISLSSKVQNLNQTKIFWLQNGELMISGIGKKEYFFTTNDSKAQTVVEAMIETTGGVVLNKKITILPSDIDLLWEAYDSYSPPFYKGKTLASHEGSIKVVALPNTSQTLGYSYKWKLDGTNKPDSSGYGKNYYIFKNGYLDTANEVEANVVNLFGASVGSERISFRTTDPKIIFYKKSPALGTLWEKALENNFPIGNSGEILVAEPYFFSTKDLNSNTLSFSWLINGEEIETPSPKNVLALSPEENASGKAEIKISINNIKTLFQKAEKILHVQL